MGWGRNGEADAAAGMPAKPVRYGAWSVILALIAPALVTAAVSYLLNLPNYSPQGELAEILALVTYGIVAPLLHATGIGFGIAGLRNPRASKPASIVGILLNIGLVALGLLLGWAAASTIGAFT